jgi:hypothetical protein
LGSTPAWRGGSAVRAPSGGGSGSHQKDCSGGGEFAGTGGGGGLRTSLPVPRTPQAGQLMRARKVNSLTNPEPCAPHAHAPEPFPKPFTLHDCKEIEGVCRSFGGAASSYPCPESPAALGRCRTRLRTTRAWSRGRWQRSRLLPGPAVSWPHRGGDT